MLIARSTGSRGSVGSVGDSYDNAPAETFIGLFKAELIHRRAPWRSFEALEYDTLEWVDRFSTRRLLVPIENIPPAEAEEGYCAAVSDDALASQRTKSAFGKPGAVHWVEINSQRSATSPLSTENHLQPNSADALEILHKSIQVRYQVIDYTTSEGGLK